MFGKGTVALAVLALLLSLSVFLLNGRSLFYFDTASYLEQGDQLLRLVGLDQPETQPTLQSNGATSQGHQSAPSSTADTTVVGSRSVAYGLAVAAIVALFGFSGVVFVNLAILFYACFSAARHMAAEPGQAVPLTVIGILAGCLGSLPFYVAFAMPDILAPVLVLLVATLAAYSDRMSVAERAAAVIVSLFAVVSHPSHLILVALLAPVALFASPRLTGRRLTMVAALFGVLLLAGLTERFAFGLAAERLLHKRVLYMPFVTTRLIADGPGYTFLEQRCPDPDYPTCLLYEALQKSDNPDRLYGPNILFSASPDLGSFRLLDDQSRSAVSAHQFAFARDVISAAPFDVFRSVVRNSVVQLGEISIDMTMPTAGMVTTMQSAWPEFPVGLYEGRLLGDAPSWLFPLTVFHAAVYLAGLGVLVATLASRRTDSRVRALVVVALAGIVLNAIVCGSISEPASRYGARLMFLIPMLAGMCLWRQRTQTAASRPGR